MDRERIGYEVEGARERSVGDREGKRAVGEGVMERREETRTRRAVRHANIGFSVRTFGPSAWETFIWRFISATYGWMGRRMGKEIALYEKAERTNNFLRREVSRGLPPPSPLPTKTMTTAGAGRRTT